MEQWQTNMEHRLRNLEAGKEALERRLQNLETEQAVGEERRQYNKERFDRIDNELRGIKNTARWAFYLIAGGILGAFVKFLIEGGLSVGP